MGYLRLYNPNALKKTEKNMSQKGNSFKNISKQQHNATR